MTYRLNYIATQDVSQSLPSASAAAAGARPLPLFLVVLLYQTSKHLPYYRVGLFFQLTQKKKKKKKRLFPCAPLLEEVLATLLVGVITAVFVNAFFNHLQCQSLAVLTVGRQRVLNAL